MALFFSSRPFQKAPFCQSTSASSKGDALLYAEATVVRDHVPLEDAARRDVEDNRMMAAVSYLGPLCLLPYFAAQHSPFAHRHAVRGMNLFLLECIYYFGTGILEQLLSLLSWQLGLICSATFFLCGLIFPVLSILGCRIALRGENKKLPFVGRIRFVRR